MNEAQVAGLEQLGVKLISLRLLGVRTGRIMTLEQVIAAASAELVELAHSDNCRALCGDVSEKMFSLLKDTANPRNLAVRATVFGEQKNQYLVITHQIESLQHRFILPLYEPAVQELLAHAITQPIWFCFSNDGGSDSFIVRSTPQVTNFRPVLAMAPKIDGKDRPDVLAKLLDATLELAHPVRIPSCIAGCRVTQVSTTLIAPEDTIASNEGSKFSHCEMN